jgi:antitoxin (DNA-binding transcriptional repressor) of toxin-antitoxin stability system
MRLLEEKKSDNLIFMKKTMTATEVARNFSEVLDLVEAGGEVEITRGKKVIARLSGQEQLTGKGLLRAVSDFHHNFGLPDQETVATYDQILAYRNAPENLVGGEFDSGQWAR